jgi:hypothetical protein
MNLKVDKEVDSVFKQESKEIKCVSDQLLVDINAELEKIANALPSPETKAQGKFKNITSASLGIVLQKGAKFGEMNKINNAIIEDVKNEELGETAEAKDNDLESLQKKNNKKKQSKRTKEVQKPKEAPEPTNGTPPI